MIDLVLETEGAIMARSFGDAFKGTAANLHGTRNRPPIGGRRDSCQSGLEL